VLLREIILRSLPHALYFIENELIDGAYTKYWAGGLSMFLFNKSLVLIAQSKGNSSIGFARSLKRWFGKVLTCQQWERKVTCSTLRLNTECRRIWEIVWTADGMAQSMGLAVMTPSYSSLCQRNEIPPCPPSEGQCADEHAEHGLVSHAIIKHAIRQHTWLEVGSFSAINIIYFVQWTQKPWTELWCSAMVIVIDSPDVIL